MTTEIWVKVNIMAKNISKGWFGREKHYITFRYADEGTNDRATHTIRVTPETYYSAPTGMTQMKMQYDNGYAFLV